MPVIMNKPAEVLREPTGPLADLGTKSGLLPRQRIKGMIRRKMIQASVEIDETQIQPASLDLRLGKMFKFDRTKLQGFVDLFNVLNAGTVLSVNQTYGAVAATNAWLTPTTIMDGRYVRFGMQMSF